MIEEIGFMGAILLALCALPQAIMSIVTGNSHGISWLFLWMWYLGELLTLHYITQTIGLHGPLFWNYFINVLFVSIIVWYKHFPREEPVG